jgi:hypothetical protein
MLTKTPFASFLANRFWKPLAMNRTFLGIAAVPDIEKRSLAQGYVWLRGEQKYHLIPHYPDPSGEGCGEINSNVEDWSRWVHAFIHRSPILSDASYTSLTTPRILSENDDSFPYLSPVFYALGWEVEYYHGYTIVKHMGSWAGFRSIMLYIPAIKWGFVMMGNAEQMGFVQTELRWHLVDEALGIAEEKRFDWRTFLDKETEAALKVESKEELFPELAERSIDAEETKPSLRSFAGTYSNKGYHEINLIWNAEEQYLEADCSDRSFAFWIKIKEHVYELWYIAEIGYSTLPEDRRNVRCQFEVDGEGKCGRVGISICEDMEGLVWYEKCEGG